LAAQHLELVAEHGDLDVLGVLASQAPKHHASNPARHEVEEGQDHRRIIAWPNPRCSAHPAEFLNPTLQAPDSAAELIANKDRPGRVRQRDLLGGLVHEYRRAA
jgi:hypothetical protein